MANKTLSPRLLESLADIRQELIDSPYVQKVLMFGEMTDDNRRYARQHSKRSQEIAYGLLEIGKKVRQLAPNQTERLFLDNAMKLSEKFLMQFLPAFETNFGPIESDIKDQPIDSSIRDFVVKCLVESANGSYLRLLSIVMIGFWLKVEMSDYIIAQPQYQSNNLLVQYLLYLDLNCKKMLDGLSQLIDANGAHITADEEMQLIKLVREIAGYEKLFHLNQ